MWDLIGKVLPGISEMMNIHPMLVHFPIALLNGFVLMELLAYLLKKEELKNAATWMLYLGTLGAGATVTAGFFAASSVPHNEVIHAIMTRHMYFGITVLFISLSLSIWRLTGKKKSTPANIVIGFIMVTIMAFGADLGGLMVYKYGVAVKAAPQPEAHDHTMGGHDHDRGQEKEEDMDMTGMTLENQGSSTGTIQHEGHDHSSHEH